MWAYTFLIYAVSIIVAGAGVYVAIAGTRFFLNDRRDADSLDE